MKTSYAFHIFIVAILVLTACNNTATVNLEAALIYKMGGVQPVARQEFYLLDKDLNEILTEQGNYDLNDLVYPIANKEENSLLTTEIIPKHIKYKLQTDFQGKAQLKDILPGIYYLYGNSETRGGRAVWNLKVDLKAGENSVILDQNNVAKAN